MTTIAELQGWFAGTYPGRNWQGLCQAVIVNAADATGGERRIYGSASEAYRASSIVSTDYTKATTNDIHYWAIPGEPDGHVALDLGGGVMLHGYRLVTGSWGVNFGTIGVGEFINARPGWTYLGFSHTNGENTVHLDVAEPPLPTGAKRFRNAPGSGVANLRSGPGRSFGVVGTIADGDYGDFKAWTHGESVDGLDVWVQGYYSGNWAWLGSFTDWSVAGLVEVPSGGTTTPTPTPRPTYDAADLSWIVEPTAADFPSWISYQEQVDSDESGDPLAKNEDDWAYYFDKYAVDQPYEPKRSIVHWWDAPAKKPTFDGVLATFLNTPDKSVDFITGPGRIAKTGSLLTSSYTTGKDGMVSWSSENDPVMTVAGDPRAELGYRTLAFLHYVIETKNPRLRGESLHLHKEFQSTACSDIDLTRLRQTIEKFFSGAIDPLTGLDRVTPTPDPDPEPEPEVPTPEPEPEVPTIPVPEKPDAHTPDTTVIGDLVQEAGSNVIIPERFRSILWWAVLAIGATLLSVQGWFAGIKEVPPDWFYGATGVALVLLPLIALVARANMPGKTVQANAKAVEKIIEKAQADS